MQRTVPVWFLLLCLLLGAIFAMLFAWSAVTGRPGRLGGTATAIAAFPDLVERTVEELRSDPDAVVRVPRTEADLGDFQPMAIKAGLDLQGLKVKADPEALARSAGWRVLLGAFAIDGSMQHAALLLSPELEVVHAWRFAQEVRGRETPTGRLFPHGHALLDDGSIIYSYDVGSTLQRVDACSKRLWSIEGQYGHEVSLTNDGQHVWALRDYIDGVLGDLSLVATADGEVVRRISMDEIIAANPSVDILEIRRKDNNWVNGNPRTTKTKWLEDPFHTNDAEPLPEALAARFPGFEAGDLLVSVRSLNLVFVMDPDTLKIKWWQSGPWRRQHDPDWQPTGEITVYDNQMDRPFSRIVGIEPASRNTRMVLDGRKNDFYSRIRGKHQILPSGNLLVTSPQQGRVFELDPEGRLVFEIYNTRPGPGKFNYPLSEMNWYPVDALEFAKDLSCEN